MQHLHPLQPETPPKLYPLPTKVYPGVDAPPPKRRVCSKHIERRGADRPARGRKAGENQDGIREKAPTGERFG